MLFFPFFFIFYFQMCAAAGAYAAWEVIKQSGCKFPEKSEFKFKVDSSTTISNSSIDSIRS